jgi:DNA polymerase-1
VKIKVPKPVTVDFETLPIKPRPDYPPAAVGVSIKYFGKKARYYAWGHPEGNNCSWGEAKAALEAAYHHKDGLLFQNGKFDVDVAEEEFGLEVPEWHRIHDTMLLLFLDDPHQKELGLKESSVRLLDMPAEERDDVVEWLIQHQPLANQGIKMTRGKGGDNYAGAYIALAPGDVVGPYADGDTIRTEKIFHLLFPRIHENGMGDAYDRERKLLPILLGMERVGVQVDLKRLRADVKIFDKWAETVDQWIIKRIKAPADINLDSGPQLVEAMLKSGVADEASLGVTKTGKYQTNKDALMEAVTDRSLLAVLRYRAGLKTCLNIFMHSWLEMAERSGGRIFTTWNQVKAPKGNDSAGTRTGRLSATWFMNMPKEFSPIFKHEAEDPKDAKKLPACPIKGLPSLPMCRGYITPFDGHVLTDRDYSQQEPRILAHFDGGALMDKYNENPWIDFHDYAKAELENYGLFYARKPVKNTNLGLIYGMGAPKLAIKNDMTVEEAKTLKNAILQLYPGLAEMYKDMSKRAAQGLPIRTWGGRVYYCEEPRMIQGRWVKFDYKLVNILIQGSAADCTKEAVIRLDTEITRLGKRGKWFIILNVHDQIVMSVPRKDIHLAMETQRVVMESIEFDVPMLSEGDWTDTNWGDMKPYDTKGKLVHGLKAAA